MVWARSKVLKPGPLPGEMVLHTGDFCRLDDEGYLYFVGRMDDIIKSRGEKVAPKEVEDVLRKHPAVLDVSVYGISSEFFGEEVAAAIRLHADRPADAQDLIAFCEARLARFKVPRHVRLVQTFPMTASGKIQKFKLREMHETELAAARQ